MRGIRTTYYSKYVKGVKAMVCHELGSFEIIQNVVTEHKPELILEIGTAVGGLTLLLHECDRSTPLVTFDKYNMSRLRSRFHEGSVWHTANLEAGAFNANVSFVLGNVFAEPVRTKLQVLLKDDRRIFLYCDGGSKPTEMYVFGKYLKQGDLLGVHDWAQDEYGVMPEVVALLEQFREHPSNKILVEAKLRTRFFIKE